MTLFTIAFATATLVFVLKKLMKIDNSDNQHWYDFWNYYYHFTEAHTPYMDNFVNKYCNVTHKIVTDYGNTEPSLGKYFLRFTDGDYVVIIKYQKQNVIFYQAYSRAQNNLVQFKNLYDQSMKKPNLVETFMIDTSNDTPKIVKLQKQCHPVKSHQLHLLNSIIEHWQQHNNYNTKALVHYRGVEKYYLGRLLKKELEKINPDSTPLLFDDFDPSAIGVNVNTFVLSKATKQTPVIIVINDIDQIYNQLHEVDSVTYDKLFHHTKSKQQFHNMLDNIGDKQHVIAIYTTLSNSAVNGEHPYQLLHTQGKIDIILEMKDLE